MYVLLVLVACVAAVYGQESVCPPVNGAVNLNDENSRKTVCHDNGRIRTDFQLTCDWENYDFQLQLTSSAALNDAQMTPVNPSVAIDFINSGSRSLNGFEKKIVPLSNEQKASCPNPRPIQLRSSEIPFIQRTPQLSATSRLEFVNGDLYYRTTILVTEEYDTPTCMAYEHYRTLVNLECCLKRETPHEPIIPPIHEYCNLTYCHDNGQWDGNCTIGSTPGTWKITVYPKTAYQWNQLQSAGLSFQAHHLQAYPSAIKPMIPGEPISPQVTFVQNGALFPVAPELEFGQSNTNVGRDPPQPWLREYTVNSFEFHSNHARDERFHSDEDFVNFRAQVQLCRETSDDTRFDFCVPPRYKTSKRISA